MPIIFRQMKDIKPAAEAAARRVRALEAAGSLTPVKTERRLAQLGERYWQFEGQRKFGHLRPTTPNTPGPQAVYLRAFYAAYTWQPPADPAT